MEIYSSNNGGILNLCFNLELFIWIVYLFTGTDNNLTVKTTHSCDLHKISFYGDKFHHISTCKLVQRNLIFLGKISVDRSNNENFSQCNQVQKIFTEQRKKYLESNLCS